MPTAPVCTRRRARRPVPERPLGCAASTPRQHQETEVIPMLKRFLIAGGILFGVLVLVGGVFGTRMYFMIQGFKSQKNISTVSEETAKQETWQPDSASVGNLDPVQGADISNQLAGNVVAVNFQSGQEVQKGQLLVQLDDSSERAQLAGFEAQLKLAQLNAQRAHDIFAKHLIAQS